MNIEEWLKQNFDYKNQHVLITGATSGIGKEYLNIFSKLQCPCLLLSENKQENESLAQFTEEQYGNSVTPITCDLSDLDQVDKLLKQLKEFNIPILINNAGFGLKGDFLSIEKQSYIDMINVNIQAPTLIAHSLLESMKENNCGVMISVSSINSAAPVARSAVYSATKSYLFNFSLAISKECEQTPIFFQTVLPGTTATAFHTKQGTQTLKMVMSPYDVARRSLDDISKLVCISNKIDRVLYSIVSKLSVEKKMSIASYLLKKRLGA